MNDGTKEIPVTLSLTTYYGLANIRQELTIKTAAIVPESMTIHDVAALLFAAEFAINNDGSKHLGKPLRAHFFME